MVVDPAVVVVHHTLLSGASKKTQQEVIVRPTAVAGSGRLWCEVLLRWQIHAADSRSGP